MGPPWLFSFPCFMELSDLWWVRQRRDFTILWPSTCSLLNPQCGKSRKSPGAWRSSTAGRFKVSRGTRHLPGFGRIVLVGSFVLPIRMPVRSFPSLCSALTRPGRLLRNVSCPLHLPRTEIQLPDHFSETPPFLPWIQQNQ